MMGYSAKFKSAKYSGISSWDHPCSPIHRITPLYLRAWVERMVCAKLEASERCPIALLVCKKLGSEAFWMNQVFNYSSDEYVNEVARSESNRPETSPSKRAGHRAYRLNCCSEGNPERLGTNKPLDLCVLVRVLEPTGEISFVPPTWSRHRAQRQDLIVDK